MTQLFVPCTLQRRIVSADPAVNHLLRHYGSDFQHLRMQHRAACSINRFSFARDFSQAVMLGGLCWCAWKLAQIASEHTGSRSNKHDCQWHICAGV